MDKKKRRFLRLKFNLFVFALCGATILLAYIFDKMHLADLGTAETTATSTEVQETTVNYIEKVQINKIESQATSDSESEEDDHGAETDQDAENLIPLYATADLQGSILAQIFTGEWAEYLGEDGDFVQVRTSSEAAGSAVTGYIAKEQADVTKLIDRGQAKSIKDAVVVLDPGHGGSDVGAESTNGMYYEKDFTLATAQAIKKSLEAAGATVYLTRSKDEYVSLDERVEISNQYAPDVFISLHYDSSDISDSLNGFTTYYYYQRDKTLANAVNKGLAEAETSWVDGTETALPNLGIKADNFSVNRENPYPSLLLELGYINSYGDLIVIWNDEYYQQVAQGITTSLTSYFASHK